MLNHSHPLCLLIIDNKTKQPIGVTGFAYDGETAELGYTNSNK